MWKEKFIENGLGSDEDSFPYVVIGNKLDLPEQRKITSEDARQWCKDNGDLPYFETSAKDSVNVEEAFQHIARNALS